MKGLTDNRMAAGAAVLLMILLLISSCKKDESRDLGPGLNVANDIVIAQRPVIQTFRMLVRSVNDSSLQMSHHAFFDGASVTYDPVQNNYSFYYLGFFSADNVFRTGRIMAELSGDLDSTGTGVRFSFIEYFEDGMKISGDDTLVNTGIDGSDLVFSNVFTNGVIVKDTVGSIAFNAELDYRLPANPAGGYLQELITVSGDITGTSSKGMAFIAEVSPACVCAAYSAFCPWIRQGSILFRLPDHPDNSGKIWFPAFSSCNDSVYYDLGSVIYRWRMQPGYLSQ